MLVALQPKGNRFWSLRFSNYCCNKISQMENQTPSKTVTVFYIKYLYNMLYKLAYYFPHSFFPIFFFFLSVPCSTWDLSCLTRDQTSAPYNGSADALTSGPLGTSVKYLVFNKKLWDSLKKPEKYPNSGK